MAVLTEGVSAKQLVRPERETPSWPNTPLLLIPKSAATHPLPKPGRCQNAGALLRSSVLGLHPPAHWILLPTDPVFDRNPLLLSSALGLLFLAACAEGGEEERAKSEIRLEASHHMFGLQANRQFKEFPIDPRRISADIGTLLLSEDSLYRIRRQSQTSGANDYSLAKNGRFGVMIDRGARLSRIRFAGGYGLEGDSNIYYFVDRFATSSAPFVGLFWGTRLVAGDPALTGDWHVVSLHTVFSKSQVLDPRNVAVALGGKLSIDKDGKITGKGVESTRATLDLAGTVKGFDDGRVDVALTYKDSQGSDDRVFRAAAGKAVILGVDGDEPDGEVGLIAMIQQRTDKADSNKLKGDYFCGGYTVFVSPTRSGTDAFDGTLTFSASGAFRLEAVGADGGDFAYSGTYDLEDDGSLELTVNGTKETWYAAVSQDYNTVILVDNFVESRGTTAKPPELNIGLAIRKKPTGDDD